MDNKWLVPASGIRDKPVKAGSPYPKKGLVRYLRVSVSGLFLF